MLPWIRYFAPQDGVLVGCANLDEVDVGVGVQLREPQSATYRPCIPHSRHHLQDITTKLRKRLLSYMDALRAGTIPQCLDEFSSFARTRTATSSATTYQRYRPRIYERIARLFVLKMLVREGERFGDERLEA